MNNGVLTQMFRCVAAKPPERCVNAGTLKSKKKARSSSGPFGFGAFEATA
jgi:hypothetical protein